MKMGAMTRRTTFDDADDGFNDEDDGLWTMELEFGAGVGVGDYHVAK